MLLHLSPSPLISFFFFFNDTATTEIYTLSLHDALPIFRSFVNCFPESDKNAESFLPLARSQPDFRDRKSTRLNSSHGYISYAVFCLKKKKIEHGNRRRDATHDRHDPRVE